MYIWKVVFMKTNVYNMLPAYEFDGRASRKFWLKLTRNCEKIGTLRPPLNHCILLCNGSVTYPHRLIRYNCGCRQSATSLRRSTEDKGSDTDGRVLGKFPRKIFLDTTLLWVYADIPLSTSFDRLIWIFAAWSFQTLYFAEWNCLRNFQSFFTRN